jgi:signal transduction histidine kinase/ActR/RegA family two-component response regulator
MKAYVEFSELDSRKLHGFKDLSAETLKPAIDRFYERILSDPQAYSIFTGPEQVERLKGVLVLWIRQLFGGPHDEGYFKRRYKIGIRHVEIGLPQHITCSAMSIMREELTRIVRERLADQNSLCRETLRSLDVLLDLEISIILEAYREEYAKERIKERFAELEKAANALEQAKSAAEKASAARSEFLANMSHEIRTPLNGILGLTRILVGMSLEPKARETVEIVHRAGDDLLVIINDILDFSKIDAGRVELEAAPFVLKTALGDVVELFDESAKEKSIDLHFDFDSQLPRTLVGDPARLRQIVRNLVGNAVKFTAEGSVTLRVRPIEEAQTDGKVLLRIEVIDTGIGIPSERLESIFEVFKQADTSTTRRYGGTGLGLSISQKLVKLMEGELQVESVLGNGSTFWFDICWPVAPNRAEVSSAELRVIATQEPLPELSVLLVDDNIVNQQVGAQMIENLGSRVQLAVNGVDALHILEKEKFHLILMDCHMPVMDGYEATKHIRELPDRRARLPIVAMTAAAMEGDRKRCLDAGMDDYISKPVDPDRLVEALRRWGPDGVESTYVANE